MLPWNERGVLSLFNVCRAQWLILSLSSVTVVASYVIIITFLFKDTRQIVHFRSQTRLKTSPATLHTGTGCCRAHSENALLYSCDLTIRFYWTKYMILFWIFTRATSVWVRVSNFEICKHNLVLYSQARAWPLACWREGWPARQRESEEQTRHGEKSEHGE